MTFLIRTAIVGLWVTMIFSGTTFGQIEQVNRKRTRNNQVLITAEDVENQRSPEEARLPAPKPAVLNVDVQIVLSKADVKTFAEAKMAEAKRVVDGDPLWMYVKFKSKLGDYVLASRDADDRQKIHYNLYAEVAPKGETGALHQVTIGFAKEDLAATEFKVSLAPALFGRNKSLPLFLMMTGTTRSGVWNNDVRLSNNVNMPRALTDNLAITPVVLDLSAGSTKYRKMESEYDSIVMRGTADVTNLPVAGSFASDQLKVKLM